MSTTLWHYKEGNTCIFDSGDRVIGSMFCAGNDTLTLALDRTALAVNAVNLCHDLGREPAEVKRLWDELADTLRSLADLQNGPPLPKYEDDWNRTMERTYAVLAEVEGLEVRPVR